VHDTLFFAKKRQTSWGHPKDPRSSRKPNRGQRGFLQWRRKKGRLREHWRSPLIDGPSTGTGKARHSPWNQPCCAHDEGDRYWPVVMGGCNGWVASYRPATTRRLSCGVLR